MDGGKGKAKNLLLKLKKASRANMAIAAAVALAVGLAGYAVNGDGKVDILDLSILLSRWGS